jgi:hypothetical protein
VSSGVGKNARTVLIVLRTGLYGKIMVLFWLAFGFRSDVTLKIDMLITPMYLVSLCTESEGGGRSSL